MSRRWLDQDTGSLDLDPQLWIDRFHSQECFDRISAKSRFPLSRLGVAGPKASLEGFPGYS
jgi:hypothetical protein